MDRDTITGLELKGLSCKNTRRFKCPTSVSHGRTLAT